MADNNDNNSRDIEQKRLNLIDQINAAQQRLNDTERESISVRQKELKIAREELVIAERGQRLLELRNSDFATFNRLTEEKNALAKIGQDLTAQDNALLQQLSQNLSDAERATIRNTAAARDNAKAKADALKGQVDLNTAVKKGAMVTGAFTGALNKAAGGTLAFASSVGGALTKVMDMAFTLSDANAEIAQQTGQVAGLNGVFDDLSLRVGENVMTLAEMKDTVIGLNTTYGDFAFLSHDAQVEVAAFTGKMLRFGGSVQDTAKLLDFFGNTMANSSTKAMGLTDNLKSLTRILGRGLQAIQKDFIALINPMTRFGDQAKKEFTEIAKFARSVGLETKAAFDIAEGFDTFEKAAERAGRINAQFGTRLNSFAIMSLKHSERIKAIRAEFQRSGLDVQQMGRREIQMLADGFGIAEETAVKFLNTRKSLHQITKEDEEANRRITDYMGAKQQIEIAIQNLFIQNGHAIKDFVNQLSDLITQLNELATGVSTTASMIKGALAGLIASPFVAGLIKVAGAFQKVGSFLGLVVGKVFGSLMIVKDLAGSLGLVDDDNPLFGKGTFFDMSQEASQQRLAAGMVGAGVGAATVSATGIGTVTAPIAALLGYGMTRSAPDLLGTDATKATPATPATPMTMPPGREFIPLEVGQPLKDGFVSKAGKAYPIDEGDAALVGTNLGQVNKNQKMVVKELTMPLTLKVGSKDFVAGIATATDVILDTTTIR